MCRVLSLSAESWDCTSVVGVVAAVAIGVRTGVVVMVVVGVWHSFGTGVVILVVVGVRSREVVMMVVGVW